MKEQIKAAEKELSVKEIANLSDAEFKTLVIRMLTEVIENQERAKQVTLIPLWPIPHTQHHKAAKWVATPWWITKAPPLTT